MRGACSSFGSRLDEPPRGDRSRLGQVRLYRLIDASWARCTRLAKQRRREPMFDAHTPEGG